MKTAEIHQSFFPVTSPLLSSEKKANTMQILSDKGPQVYWGYTIKTLSKEVFLKYTETKVLMTEYRARLHASSQLRLHSFPDHPQAKERTLEAI